MNLHYFLKQIGFSQTHIGEALKAKKNCSCTHGAIQLAGNLKKKFKTHRISLLARTSPTILKLLKLTTDC